MSTIAKPSPLPAARTMRYSQSVAYDTYVSKNGQPSYDNDEFLVVKLDDYDPGHREAYLSFDTSKLAPLSIIGELQLMLHTDNRADDGTIEIHIVEDHSFWGRSFDYAHRPPRGERVASFTMKEQDPDGWITVSIKDETMIQKLLGNGKMSLMLQGLDYRKYHRFSSSKRSAYAPSLTAVTRHPPISASKNIRYLNFICTREENGFSVVRLSEIDIIDDTGTRLDKQAWEVVDGTSLDGWQTLFDNDRQTQYKVNQATPVYLTIDLKKEVSIAALVFSPQLAGFEGRPADVLIYGKPEQPADWALIGSRAVPHGNGNAPHVIFTWASALASQTERSYSLPIKTSVGIEQARLKHRIARSPLNVTGLHFNEPGIVCIWIESTDPKSSDYLEAREGHWDGSLKHRLHYGLNAFYFSSAGGQLYFQLASNDSTDNKRSATIRVMAEHVDFHPVFESNVTSQSAWLKMLETYDTTNVVEMFTRRVILTVRAKDFLPLAKQIDMQALADTYDNGIAPTELSAGVLATHSNALHHPDVNPYHFVPSEGGYMSATKNRLKYHYSLTPRMLNEAGTFWGIWHEIGHTLQTTALYWAGQSEVSVNIYPFAQRAWSGPISKLASQYDPNFVKAYAELNSVDNYSQLSSLSRELMFHHLFFIHGEKNMYALHQRYRANLAGEINDPEFRIGATDDESMNVMAMISSKHTQSDLTPFYLFWKYPLTEQTLSTIKGYGFSPISDFEKLPSDLIVDRPPEDFDMVFDET
ncbi:M60 family metallopeptidase [Pseudomonas putida]|uniref:DNRLRE domain-containing protein n=1 Tax=Pseudomonas putida TaxID=303 RepID=A0A6I6XLT6_PSEPU|nr:M60 family metallopeptidase [Pseudomonas putida]QHG64850.2 DNRLRE domain-containing protein [Pseudomonas putida]